MSDGSYCCGVEIPTQWLCAEDLLSRNKNRHRAIRLCAQFGVPDRGRYSSLLPTTAPWPALSCCARSNVTI